MKRVHAIGIGKACFNEAGAIMPRSGAGFRKDAAPEPIRFNEAGAIMPRSGSRTPAPRSRSSTCFNEAGAIMPRSGQTAPARRGAAEPASMRPGQSCPGVEQGEATYSLRDAELQ